LLQDCVENLKFLSTKLGQSTLENDLLLVRVFSIIKLFENWGRENDWEIKQIGFSSTENGFIK
jgi:hypothetical protein